MYCLLRIIVFMNVCIGHFTGGSLITSDKGKKILSFSDPKIYVLFDFLKLVMDWRTLLSVRVNFSK